MSLLRRYADDTTGYYSDTSPAVLQFVVNSELSLCHSGLIRIVSLLLIMTRPRQALTLGPCLYNNDIVVNGVKVETQESIEILGVTLDTHAFISPPRTCAKHSRHLRSFLFE